MVEKHQNSLIFKLNETKSKKRNFDFKLANQNCLKIKFLVNFTLQGLFFIQNYLLTCVLFLFLQNRN